jgi:hypothetical protein
MFMEVLDNIDPYYCVLYAQCLVLFNILICIEMSFLSAVSSRIKEGRYPLRGWFYWRKWFLSRLSGGLDFGYALFHTVTKLGFFTGGTPGKGSRYPRAPCEPRIPVGRQGLLLADDVMVGHPAYGRFYQHRLRCTVGDRTFVGNRPWCGHGPRRRSLMAACLPPGRQSRAYRTLCSAPGQPFAKTAGGRTLFGKTDLYPAMASGAVAYVIEFFRVTAADAYRLLGHQEHERIDIYQDWLPLWFRPVAAILYLAAGWPCGPVAVHKWWWLPLRERKSTALVRLCLRTELDTGYTKTLVHVFAELLRGTFPRWPLRMLGMRMDHAATSIPPGSRSSILWRSMRRQP